MIALDLDDRMLLERFELSAPARKARVFGHYTTGAQGPDGIRTRYLPVKSRLPVLIGSGPTLDASAREACARPDSNRGCVDGSHESLTNLDYGRRCERADLNHRFGHGTPACSARLTPLSPADGSARIRTEAVPGLQPGALPLSYGPSSRDARDRI